MTRARLVYDDDCGFCTWAAFAVADHAPDVEPVAFSALSAADRERLPPDWERCAHLLVDGRRYSCGEAMTRAYERTDLPLAGLVPILRRVPGFGFLREAGYRFVAANRDWFGRHVASLDPR
ncbi:MAG: thiol-disulfide oxidoreductase DCC family protein [Halobacteriales archaeon]